MGNDGMADSSKIAWTDSTFNPWIGCTEVTAECDHCYARDLAERWGWAEWGAGEPRHRTSAANWQKPRQWNRTAEKSGQRRRVFCASLADWADKEVPEDWRADLFHLIRETPWLDWLLLTKRHALAYRYLPAHPEVNIRIGMTIGDASTARLRLPALIDLGRRGWQTFVSYEPALGPVDWPEWLATGALHWIIIGGESGPQARPFDPQWARDTRDACQRAGVPFFMKQMGERARLKDRHGADPMEWPADLLIQEFPALPSSPYGGENGLEK